MSVTGKERCSVSGQRTNTALSKLCHELVAQWRLPRVGVDLEDVLARFDRWQWEVELAIEAARSTQSRVDCVESARNTDKRCKLNIHVHVHTHIH